LAVRSAILATAWLLVEDRKTFWNEYNKRKTVLNVKSVWVTWFKQKTGKGQMNAISHGGTKSHAYPLFLFDVFKKL